MFISEEGLNLIKKYEGKINYSYDDYNDKIVMPGDNVIGTLTIGYGHIEGVYPGQYLTDQQCEELLRSDMIEYCRQVDYELNRIVVPFEINQNVYDALVSFDYNCGSGSLATLLANGTRSKIQVADMMLEYRNKGTVWEYWLLLRRTEERELFLREISTPNVVETECKVEERITVKDVIDNNCRYYEGELKNEVIKNIEVNNYSPNYTGCSVLICIPIILTFIFRKIFR